MKCLMICILAALILMINSEAKAAPFVCFEGLKTQAELQSEDQLMLAAINCAKQAKLAKGLNATSVILAATGFAAACTGFGAPVSVILEGGVVGLQVLSVTIGMLPCESSSSEIEVKRLTREVLCSELALHGVTCKLKP